MLHSMARKVFRRRKACAGTWMCGLLIRVRNQGEEHRRLRAALSVGFTPAAVREYRAEFERIARSVRAYYHN
jgi:cytochrome P450